MQERRWVQQSQSNQPRPFGGPLGEWTTAKDLLGKDDWDALRKKIDAKSKRGSKRKKESRRPTSSSSSSSSESSSSSKNRSSAPQQDQQQPSSSNTPSNPELDKLKQDALERLLKLRDEPLATRKKMWRALLLEFHPDKQPDNKENATAVFQFLQKGKALLDLKGTDG